MIYCDTSVLLSLYCGDVYADLATEWFDALPEAVAWTPLHQVEFFAGLEARVGRRQTSRSAANAIRAELLGHLGPPGFLIPQTPSAWTRVMGRAEALVLAWGAQLQSRSLDALHVACCLELALPELWTFDVRQARLAKVAGLCVRTRKTDDQSAKGSE